MRPGLCFHGWFLSMVVCLWMAWTTKARRSRSTTFTKLEVRCCQDRVIGMCSGDHGAGSLKRPASGGEFHGAVFATLRAFVPQTTASTQRQINSGTSLARSSVSTALPSITSSMGR